MSGNIQDSAREAEEQLAALKYLLSSEELKMLEKSYSGNIWENIRINKNNIQKIIEIIRNRK